MKKMVFEEPEMEVVHFDIKDIFTAESTCDTFDAKGGSFSQQETTYEEDEIPCEIYVN